MAKEFM